MVATRTSVPKGLNDGYLYMIRANSNSIVAARSVGQRLTMIGETTFATPLTDAIFGAGYAGSSSSVSAYAVALTAVNGPGPVVITIGSETVSFAIGSPPGTAIPFSGAIDIQTAPTTMTGGEEGNMFAIVEQPPTYSTGRIDFVQSKSNEPAELNRDIRDKGSLMHRKKNALEAGVLSLTSFYANNQAGVSKYAGQEIIVILERDDNRDGVVTEKEIYYGARINVTPPINESTGDTDSDTTVSVSYELMAIVGESV